jgi:iron complex transport system permease protein
MSQSRSLVLKLSLLLVALAGVSLLLGRSGWLWPWRQAGRDADLALLILWELRAPRLLLAILVGGALGLAGAVLQGLTRNPLAEPGLLGVSSGAALGAVIAIYSGLGAMWTLSVPVFGLVGALLGTSLTLTLGANGGVLGLILAGAAVSGLMLAGTALMLNLAPNPYAAYEISHWMMGSLADRSWDQLLLAAPFIAAGTLLLLGTGRALNALSLGEQQAASLGVDLRALRRQVLLGTALAVGAATSVTGTIGFIGLLAPHLVRSGVGHEPRRVLVPATLCGAVLLLAADIATRALPFDQELKLGVLTGLVGSPFFMWLVWRMKSESP